MKAAILAAKSDLDSLGGVIECAAVGVPAGWGDPMFGGMENRIAQMVFGIPAIRGIEFGLGFPAARLTGSRHNDAYYMDGDTVKTRTNHHGGILGGITTGMPVVFRAAVKPTASIARRQESVSLSDSRTRPWKSTAATTPVSSPGPCRWSRPPWPSPCWTPISAPEPIRRRTPPGCEALRL